MGTCAIKGAHPNLIQEEGGSSSSASFDSRSGSDSSRTRAREHPLAPLAPRPELSSEVSQVMRILINFEEIKCPVCLTRIDSEDAEIHLLMCLTRTKLHYNEDKITSKMEKLGGECIICLEELKEDDLIARLPCLCVYHKSCIDQWFLVSRTCPSHPTTYNSSYNCHSAATVVSVGVGGGESEFGIGDRDHDD